MSNRKDLVDFVYSAVFRRQIKTFDEIFRKARRNGFDVTYKQLTETVNNVCTPYKAKR